MMSYRPVLCVAAVALACLLTGCTKSSSLISIQITPATASIGTVGGTAQFTAIGTYSKGGSHPTTTQNITDEATWASSSTGVATVDSAGLATAVSTGTTTITATMNGSDGPVVGTASLTVTGGTGGPRELTAITITPSAQTLNTVGATAQFIAIGTYTAPPTTQDLTNAVTWVSSTTNVATINSSGLATAVGCATSSCVVTITASATDPTSGATIIGTATVTVATGGSGGQRQLTTITIIPSTQVLSTLGETAQFIVLGTYSAPPTTENLAGQVTWVSSVPGVATIDSSGLATAVACGTSSCLTTITATATSQSGSTVIGAAALTVSPGSPVNPRALSAITILPGLNTQTLYTIGETSQFIAIGTYTAAPTTADITDSVTWASSDVGLATINSSGLATAVSCGSPTPPCISNITASVTDPVSGFIVGTSNISVDPNGGGSPLPSLSVYLVGAGTGTVVSNPVGINCNGSGAGCTAYFPQGSTVTLTATPSSGSFGGWSANCTPNTTSPCSVIMNTNQTVGAIFN